MFCLQNLSEFVEIKLLQKILNLLQRVHDLLFLRLRSHTAISIIELTIIRKFLLGWYFLKRRISLVNLVDLLEQIPAAFGNVRIFGLIWGFE